MDVADRTDAKILVGPVADAIPALQAVAGKRRLPLITDARVFDLHGSSIAGAMAIEPLFVPEGEAAKDWPVLIGLIERLAAMGHDRQTSILSLGGGSVGDVAGLAAGLFKRGCPVVHLPTTLLAQVDSAVGGKTAIDACGQKNLVGMFHARAMVIVDPAFLKTLDQRQLRAGYAEIVKYGLIDDPSFFEWCEDNGRALVGGDQALRYHAITHCIAAKQRLIGDDHDDRTGHRALLNLGHSFAHAIESEAGLGSVLHGEAVAVGMVLAFGFSAATGLCGAEHRDRVAAHLESISLPVSLADLGLTASTDRLMRWLAHDKKNDRDGLSLILAKGIGRAFLSRGVDPSAVAAFLHAAP